MGSKNSTPLPHETKYEYAWSPPPETAATTAVKDFQFDPTVQTAAQNAAFSNAGRKITEGGGGYQSSGNKLLDKRATQLGLTELAQAYSGSVGDANMQRQGMKYGQTLDYARLMAPQSQTTRTSGYTSEKGSFWGDLLRGSVQGAATGFAAACDERLKENITQVSPEQALKVVCDTPVMGFNYKGDEQPMIGWSAQKVALTQPAALTQHGVGSWLGLNLMPMTATNWAATQALAAANAAHSAELIALRQIVMELQQQLGAKQDAHN